MLIIKSRLLSASSSAASHSLPPALPRNYPGNYLAPNLTIGRSLRLSSRSVIYIKVTPDLLSYPSPSLTCLRPRVIYSQERLSIEIPVEAIEADARKLRDLYFINDLALSESRQALAGESI